MFLGNNMIYKERMCARDSACGRGALTKLSWRFGFPPVSLSPTTLSSHRTNLFRTAVAFAGMAIIIQRVLNAIFTSMRETGVNPMDAPGKTGSLSKINKRAAQCLPL
jgi:hypothetical protein